MTEFEQFNVCTCGCATAGRKATSELRAEIERLTAKIERLKATKVKLVCEGCRRLGEVAEENERLRARVADLEAKIEWLHKDNGIVRNAGVAAFFAIRDGVEDTAPVLDLLDWALSYDRDDDADRLASNGDQLTGHCRSNPSKQQATE